MKNKNKFVIKVQENALQDKGDGIIEFGVKGLTITDNSEQWNGTKYDIATMNIDNYGGLLTANHSGKIQDVIGRVLGLQKIGNRVVIKGIQFAIEENALALYAYNMMKSKFLTDFSIETVGPWPDEEGVYMNSSLVGLSLIVVGNNKKARVNEAEFQQIAMNSLAEAKEEGLDTSYIEENFVCYNDDTLEEHPINNSDKTNTMKFVTVKNSREFAVTVKFKNAAGDEVEKELKTGETVDVSEDQKNAVETQINSAQAPQKDIEAVVNSKVQEAVKPLLNTIEEMRKEQKELFSKAVKEPEFKANNGGQGTASSDLAKMDYTERHGKQINYAWELLKNKDQSAFVKLNDINKFHLEQLQEKKLVKNSMTIADMGNFVISPELLTDIEGHRSDFAPLLSRFTFRDTLSLQMAWLKRQGDINMQEVEFCDDDNDGNLKPVTEYDATFQTSNLKEVAGVTPVCDAATRFLAVDLLGDIAQGYRTDYDRKRAQLLIARLQQAVNSTGNKKTMLATTDVTALKSWIELMSALQEEIMNGLYIFNSKTYAHMLGRQMGAGINTETGFGIFTRGETGPLFLGQPYVVVPNELMPSLNTNNTETKNFTIEGVSVAIDQAVFYVDPSTFSGRTSGGLKYDLSTEAAYEVNGEVRSAYQRNEIVLRGSFFRGGAVRDTAKVVSMGAPAVS